MKAPDCAGCGKPVEVCMHSFTVKEQGPQWCRACVKDAEDGGVLRSRLPVVKWRKLHEMPVGWSDDGLSKDLRWREVEQ